MSFTASYKNIILKNSNNMFKLLKKSVLTFILILPFLFSSQKAEATHVMGADITYKCVDSLKFEFTITYYRWCAGVGFSTPQTFIECSNGSNTSFITPTFVSIKEITPVCATASGECVPANTRISGAEGIEQHTYKVTVDFKNSPYSNMVSCGKVRLRTGQCCRNSNINTGAANAQFQTFAEIDLSQSHCNSSPTLTSEPIAILCCDQPFLFNNGALDTTDFDSLSYSWAHPKGTNLGNIGYSGTNYAYNHPFQAFYPGSTGPPLTMPNANPPVGIYLDPVTGDIIFTPTRCNEITVAVIEVNEWRKDNSGTPRIAGTIRRDMQFITKTCPNNNPPVINGPYSYDICEGDKLCFDITTQDIPITPSTPGDTTTVTWNQGIPGATFTITNPLTRLRTGRFCWTPNAGTARDLPYTFTATARDNFCPLNALAIRGFSVRVKQPTAAISMTILGDTMFCIKDSLRISVPVDSGSTYQWLLNNTVITGGNNSFFYPQTTGAYSVRVINNLSCATESRGVYAQVFPLVNNTTIVGASSNIIPLLNYTYLVSADTSLYYTWAVSNGAIASGMGTNKVDIVWNVTKDGILYLTRSNGFCESIDSLLIRTTLGILDNENEIFLYPNPTSDLIRINQSGLFKYEIYNDIGQIIDSGSSIEIIDVRQLSKGNYHLVIFTDKDRFNYIFLKR